MCVYQHIFYFSFSYHPFSSQSSSPTLPLPSRHLHGHRIILMDYIWSTSSTQRIPWLHGRWHHPPAHPQYPGCEDSAQQIILRQLSQGRGYMGPTPARDPNPFRTVQVHGFSDLGVQWIFQGVIFSNFHNMEALRDGCIFSNICRCA